MYTIIIEVHATPSNYWGKMEFLDKAGNLHERDLQGDRRQLLIVMLCKELLMP